MKVALAGGFGTRLSEYTDTIEKPFGYRWKANYRTQGYLSKFEHNEFYIALGYKGD